MKTYTQLTQEQRYQISAMKKIGSSQKEIAEEIGVNKGTISREVRRNAGERGYRPKQAHEKALRRRSKAQVQIGGEVWEIVEAKLRQEWSPEQVSGWLKREGRQSLSHEWIYQHILVESWQAVIYTVTCAVTKSVANAMAAMIGEENCPIGSVSKSVQNWSSNVNVSAIGKWTPWLGRVTEGLW